MYRRCLRRVYAGSILHTQIHINRTETKILNAFFLANRNVNVMHIAHEAAAAKLHGSECRVTLLTSWAYLTYFTHVTELLTCGFWMYGSRDIYLKLLILFHVFFTAQIFAFVVGFVCVCGWEVGSGCVTILVSRMSAEWWKTGLTWWNKSQCFATFFVIYFSQYN